MFISVDLPLPLGSDDAEHLAVLDDQVKPLERHQFQVGDPIDLDRFSQRMNSFGSATAGITPLLHTILPNLVTAWKMRMRNNSAASRINVTTNSTPISP